MWNSFVCGIFLGSCLILLPLYYEIVKIDMMGLLSAVYFPFLILLIGLPSPNKIIKISRKILRPDKSRNPKCNEPN